MEETCHGKDCDRAAVRKGLCKAHAHMLWRTGSTDKPLGFRRPKGELTRMLRAASVATTQECIKVTMPSRGRSVVHFNGRQMYAARAVYTMAHGDPGAAFVLHTCGNGHAGCININHLYAGDHGLNMRDMVTDDNSTRGVRNVHAKLTETTVREIRLLLLSGTSAREAAQAYGVSLSAITMMTSGKTWGWLPWPNQADGTPWPVKFKGQALLSEASRMDDGITDEGA